jgi:HEAT repeat protein
MKNHLRKFRRHESKRDITSSLLRGVICTLIAIGLGAVSICVAQSSDDPVTVSSVSAHQTANGTVVTIGADGPLNRAQTWQDKDGFHVVIPDSGVSDLVKSGKGVKVRRIGSAIEILLQTKQGTPVGVQASDNRINLTVEGKLEALSGSTEVETVAAAPSSQSSSGNQVPTYYSGPASSGISVSSEPSSYPSTAGYPAGTTATTPAPDAGNGMPAAAPPPGERREPGEYNNAQPEGNSAEAPPEEGGAMSTVFSSTSLLIVAGLGIIGLLVVRRFKSQKALPKDRVIPEAQDPDVITDEEPRWQPQPANTAMVRGNANAPQNAPARERKELVKQPVNVPPSLYGAYRVDQEVGKLVLGQPHRMDVLSSRGPDDRRAIEASLVKAVISAESSDDERRRARSALEEYGFVARQCATLLLAADAFDRTSAARALGEIGSAAALPFLLESLYDHESIVRNQAVVSIGELKVPSSIGALLDMARKHPDVPSSLVSRALSACSVDGLDFFDAVVPRGTLASANFNEAPGYDIDHLEPASSVEDLPESTDDPGFAEAMADVTSEDVDLRGDAVKNLAQYSVGRSVTALTAVARRDPESSIRSNAISSLATINHESVFSAVLFGLADESREVRAASARALSRLSFDRADAYVRVIETSDEQTLRDVAQACIKAGVVAQNIDRLASSDHRQAYEAFSLISMLVKANMFAPVVDAIRGHSNINVRLSALHLLSTTGDGDVLEQLRKLSEGADVPEEVMSALLDAMYKLEQSKPILEEPVNEFIVRNSDHESDVMQVSYKDQEKPDEFVLHTHSESDQEVDEV